MKYEFKGRHYMASFKSCKYPLGASSKQLSSVLRGALEKVDASIVSYVDENFTNNGYTCVFLLKESHCSIHTYPEHASAFIDFFTCDMDCKMVDFHNYLVSILEPNSADFQIVDRQ
jgi:S-adenosylmethionine decarboxylase